MDNEKLDVVKERLGFIAALDQSGGSTAGTLERYGVLKTDYSTEEEMFDKIHEMRARVMTSPSFTGDRILGCILFYKTMKSMIEGKHTADYLWDEKRIVSFLKVDKGLEDENNGVRLMKDIPDLDDQCIEANHYHIFGTKMRSVIYAADKEGIKNIVKQQFDYAKKICSYGLVPIIEPEVDIHIDDKEEAETILKEEIINVLKTWDEKDLIMFKFTLPDIPNFYKDLMEYPAVIKIVALSGGYELDEACKKLYENNGMIASFSRALLQDLNVNQTDDEFNKVLKDVIDKIYEASIA